MSRASGPSPPPRASASPTASRASRSTPRTCAELVELIARATPGRRAERLRPALQRADLRRLLRGAGHLPGHGDDALAPAPRASPRAARGDARRLPAGRAARSGRSAGLLALVGIGVEPGLSDVFARHAADELFSSIEEVGVRDGADLVVEGYDFAPTFSIWTTIEECLNPPLIWERERGFYTTAPFSEPEMFEFPEGIGPVECVNVEHEEVVLIPRWVDCERVTFKYGLGQEFIDVLSTLHKLGLDCTDPVSVRGVEVAPRDVVAAALPDPATLGERMSGRTCAGTWVTGTGKDGAPRSTYLYHVVDNETTMREYGSQAVVWQTAINPAVALELLDRGDWKRSGRARPGGLPGGAVPGAARRVRRAARRARADALGEAPATPRRCSRRRPGPTPGRRPPSLQGRPGGSADRWLGLLLAPPRASSRWTPWVTCSRPIRCVGRALDRGVEQPGRRRFGLAREERAGSRSARRSQHHADDHADPAEPQRQREPEVDLFLPSCPCGRSI